VVHDNAVQLGRLPDAALPGRLRGPGLPDVQARPAPGEPRRCAPGAPLARLLSPAVAASPHMRLTSM